MNKALSGSVESVSWISEDTQDWLKHRVQRMFSYFPVLFFLLAALAFFDLIRNPGFLALGKLLFVLYLFPVLTFRIVNYFAPIKNGKSYIVRKKGYHPWIVAFKIQNVYNAIPVLETALRLFPDLYCAWLRLWGSKIGKDVSFTPQVEILDRTHLDLGDHCFIGNKTYLSPHVFWIKNGKMILLIKPIKIGKGTFVGFSSRLGPGVTIGDGIHVPAGADFYPNEHIATQEEMNNRGNKTPKNAAAPGAAAERI